MHPTVKQNKTKRGKNKRKNKLNYLREKKSHFCFIAERNLLGGGKKAINRVLCRRTEHCRSIVDKPKPAHKSKAKANTNWDCDFGETELKINVKTFERAIWRQLHRILCNRLFNSVNIRHTYLLHTFRLRSTPLRAN